MKSDPPTFAALWKKELSKLRISPVTIAGFLLFLLGTSVPFFFLATPDGSALVFGHYTARIPFVSAIVLPALSMGIWSPERKEGTRTLHFPLPASNRSIVTAKFAALLSVWAILLALTLPVLFGVESPEAGAVLTSFLLLFFYGTACLAAGLLFSLLFKSSAATFFTTAALLMLCNIIPMALQTITLPSWATSVFLPLSFAWHLEAATRGILDSRDFLFYLIPTAAVLETTAVLLARRRIRR